MVLIGNLFIEIVMHMETNSLREDFTMGASFGATRSLAILHEKTEQDFEFPQHNNDVFAFTSNVNKKFLHGVLINLKI